MGLFPRLLPPLCVCLCPSDFVSTRLRPGPKAARHDVGVRGRATPAERWLLPGDGGVRGSSLRLQDGPGGLPVQGRGVRQGAADHGQCV